MYIFTYIALSGACLYTERFYIINRLAPVKRVPGAFQKIMDMRITDIAAYIDDILISGSTIEKHLNNINQVLVRLYKYNFHMKFDKFNFFVKELKYLGLKSDPDDIRTVELELSAPKELNCF